MLSMWARIEGNWVVETINEDPAGRFHESLVWVPCQSTVKVGDIYDGRSFASEPADPGMLQSSFEQAIQAHLDTAARSQGYDSIATAVSYAEEPAIAKFQQDGKAFRTWRSLVWAYAYEQLDAVKEGKRNVPTVEDFLAELPGLKLEPSPS